MTMRNEEFMTANKTFSGHLCKIKESGKCVKNTSKDTLTPQDVKNAYRDYFIPYYKTNPRVLQHKVYFELHYYMARRKNQGDEITYNVHDGDRHMIFEQHQAHDRCPVRTYELYTSKLSEESHDFFQTPNHQLGNPLYDKWYKKSPVSIGTIGSFMAIISQNATSEK